MYPVFGFGGRLPSSPAGGASHCFALNGDIFNPECNQVYNVMQAYYNTIQKPGILFGPTKFSPILTYVNDYVSATSGEISQYNQKYNLCLILTDGVINDLDQTIDEIVRASDQPLSIIIVGVGNADFSQMETLDGDITPLFSQKLNQYRKRDIVQFVPFNKFQGDPYLLAKEVLAEIPKQMTSCFLQKRITPNPKKMEDRGQIQIRNKMRNEMAVMMKKPDSFYDFRKQQMAMDCMKMGLNYQQVIAFLD